MQTKVGVGLGLGGVLAFLGGCLAMDEEKSPYQPTPGASGSAGAPGAAGTSGGVGGSGGGAAGAAGGGVSGAGAGGAGAGAGGLAGSGGSAGSGGEAPTAGSGGAGGSGNDGPYVCAQTTIDETKSSIATAAETVMAGNWTSPSGLTGGAYAYPGTFTVNGLGGKGTVAKADYAGFGLSFNQCIKVSEAVTGVKFTIKGTGITKVKCHLGTWATTPVDKTYKKGACTGAAGVTCISPGKDVTVTSEATPVTLTFAELAGKGVPAEDAVAIASNLAGIGCSWQAGAEGAVELALDAVEFTK